jgi:hypothetical protein
VSFIAGVAQGVNVAIVQIPQSNSLIVLRERNRLLADGSKRDRFMTAIHFQPCPPLYAKHLAI